MSVGRISTNYQISQSIAWLQKNQSTLNGLQESVATGKNINRPSDNPLALTQLMTVNRGMNDDAQFMKNMDAALAELSTTDTLLSQTSDLINRATELATQGASVSTGATGMTSISKEVDLMIDQLLQLANTQQGDVFVFSGMATDQKAYSRSGDALTFLSPALSSSFERKVALGDGNSTAYNWLGSSVFGETQVVAGPPDTVTGNGVFKTLVDLKNSLTAGDTTAVRSQLDALKTDLNNINTAQAEVGAIQNRIQLTKDRSQTRIDSLTQQYAALQDIDLPKMITNLNFQEQMHQASLSIMGRILPKTLMDFLR